MGTVLCLATGGTIASTFDPECGGWTPTLKVEDLMERVPGLGADVEVGQLAQTNSTSFAPQQVLEWSAYVGQALDRPEVSGVVLLQGTNTLEECAFLFDLAL